MRTFLIFVQKEFRHIFRDRWTTIILIILPVVMIILFGFGIRTDIRNTWFAVYDPSRDEATSGIVNKLSTSEYFSLDRYLSAPGQTEDLFKEGKIGLVVIFGENFHNSLVHGGDAEIQLIADGTDPNTASLLTSYANALISSYISEEALSSPESRGLSIIPQIKLLYNPSLKSTYNIVPGIMGMMMMLICAIMTSVSIAREKESGTMEVLLVSPAKPFMIIVSKLIPYFVISVINFITILLLSVYVLKVPVAGSLVLLSGFALLFIFVSLSLGIFISTLVDKQIVALLVSGMILMIPAVILSGLMFPVESMPKVLQWISHLLPVKWCIIGIRNIMIKGTGLSSIIKEVIILLSMGAFILTLSVKKFKYRLE